MRLDRARIVGCRAGRGRLDGVDVELEQLSAKAAGESLELVLVGAGAGVDRELEGGGLGIHANLISTAASPFMLLRAQAGEYPVSTSARASVQLGLDGIELDSSGGKQRVGVEDHVRDLLDQALV